MLISVNGAAFSYGDKLILDGVTFALNEGEKTGLVGANGEGKTTLIKLMLGGLSPDSGEVIKKNGAKIGWLEQNGGLESEATVYGEMISVFSEETEAVKKLTEISSQIALCNDEREMNRLSARMEALEKFVASRDAYNVDVKVRTVLNGMGFADNYEQIISTMSGGEKTRLKLVKLLLEEPDLLVLDEPTNHLDIKTMFWLEDYLRAFKGAVFVVSHDRYFLDRVITRTLEIENKKLSSYSGNYSKYKILKAEKVALAEKEYEKQREEIKKLQTFVDKNIVRATTAKSAQSRVKQLEKMEILEKPYIPPAPPKFKFTYDTPPYKDVLIIKGLNLTIGGKTLIEGGNLSVERGKKIAVTGENGTGKSTLLKAVVSGGNPAIAVGRYVAFAVYDQENANLNPENTVLAELWERHVAFSQTDIRSALARCGLFAEDIDKKVKELSGGERAKLALSVFESERGNVLILDEPTNHLDLPARESLERALKEFDGTVIFVSHDRYFISAVADGIAEIENRRLNFYDCGYPEYEERKAAASKEVADAARERERQEYSERKTASYRSARERAEEAKRKERIKAVEADICRVETQIAELEAKLADPTVSADYDKLKPVLDGLEEARARQEKLYAEYETLI